MLKCGMSEVDITPALGAEIPGHFKLRKAVTVKDPLKVSAIYFENESGKVAVVSCDTIVVPESVCERAKSLIAEKLGTNPENTLVCATHTHYGGAVETWGEFVHEDRAYFDFLTSRIIDSVVLASQDAREVKIAFNSGADHEIAHYRDFILPNGKYATNAGIGTQKKAAGDIDPEVFVLRVDNADGTPYGALVNYACHCDCLGGIPELSADFPGEMRVTLRKVYGDGFHPMFVNGFCGNINHVMFEKGEFLRVKDYYRSMGRRLAGEAIRVFETAFSLTDSAELCGAQAYMQVNTREPSEYDLAMADAYEKNPTGSVSEKFYAEQAREFQRKGVQPIDLCVQLIKIGDLIIYGLPGEIYVEFQLMLKEKSPSKHAICANLTNGCIGYVPTRELFQPGIYPARLCDTAQVAHEAGYQMVDRLLELAAEV